MTRFAPIFVLPLLLACSPRANPGNADEHDHGGEQDAHDEHDDGHEEAVVTLSGEAVAAARLVVAPAASGALAPVLSMPAHIALDPRREAVVSAWISGQVDTISARPGDEVRRGTVLATVQSPELGEAVSAYRGAKAADDAVHARLERLGRLESDGVASRAQVLKAEAEHAVAEGALGAAMERLRILGVDPAQGDAHNGERYPSRVPVASPIAGKVLTASVSAGQRVEPGDALFHVGDLAEVWLLLDVYERDLAFVFPGQEVRFTVEAWPGETFQGQVEQVGDWVEPEARTVEVRVVVSNPDGQLKPNMFASASLAASRTDARRGIVLPAEAVQRVDGEDVVFVEESAGRFVAREVAITERSSTEVLLEAGLEEGTAVVISGAFALRSELEKSELGEGHAH